MTADKSIAVLLASRNNNLFYHLYLLTQAHTSIHICIYIRIVTKRKELPTKEIAAMSAELRPLSGRPRC